MAVLPFDPDKHCGAHPDSPHGPCRAPKGRGTGHPGEGRCKHHGGASPQAEGAAAERRAQAEAQAEIRRLLDDPTAPPVTDALDRLAALAGRLERALDVIGERVSALNSVGIVTAAGGEQVRAEVRVWEILLGHLARALDLLVKHGHAERRTRVAEEIGEAYGRLVRAALDALPELTPEQRGRSLAAAERSFVVLAGGAA